MEWWTRTVEFLNNLLSWFTKDKQKKLPYSEIELLEFKNDKIAVSVLAKIVLQENTQPHVDEFLSRVSLGRPFCPKCNLQFESLRTSWVADFEEIGYMCERCGAKYKITEDQLLNAMKSQIRKSYNSAWKIYKEKIKKMTKGNENKYKLY